MSVLVTHKESKLEAITFALELHDMLIQFMQRSFGVKNFEKVIRSKYEDIPRSELTGDKMMAKSVNKARLEYLLTQIERIASELGNHIKTKA